MKINNRKPRQRRRFKADVEAKYRALVDPYAWNGKELGYANDIYLEEALSFASDWPPRKKLDCAIIYRRWANQLEQSANAILQRLL